MRALLPSVTAEPTSWIISGWKTRAATAAVRVERASTRIAGSFFQIITTVSTGTIISHGEMLNLAASTSR